VAGDKHSKTEAPTPKKKKEARRKGQVAKTQELVTWCQLLLVATLARPIFGAVGSQLEAVLHQVGRIAAQPDEQEAIGLFGSAVVRAMLAMAPLVAGITAVGVLGNLAQVGFIASSHHLKPKFEKLNVAKGIKRLLSPASFWEGGKTALRGGIVAVVALPAIGALGREVAEMGDVSVAPVLTVVAARLLTVVRNAAAAGLVLAVADYAFQKRRVMGQLRMSKQEVKDEHKQAEGDPHLKAHLRSLQQAMSRNRMMAAIPDATAVIVNPTHIAIAIRYQPGDGAPTVVAKGRGAIALRIREEAERHGVPITRDVPLARALHASCEIGQEIPVDLYEAVARILAVVMALGRRAA